MTIPSWASRAVYCYGMAVSWSLSISGEAPTLWICASELSDAMVGRGAAGSAGRTSWSGKAELADYVSVYGFALCYIDAVSPDVSRADTGVPGTDEEVSDTHGDANLPILVLGGYSYGSMIAAHLPPPETVARLFANPTPDSAESEIKRRAIDLAKDLKACFEMYAGDMTPSAPKVTVADQATGTGEAEPSSPAHSRTHSRSVAMGGYESDTAGRRTGRDTSRKSLDGERVRERIQKFRRRISYKEHRVHPSPSTSDGEAHHVLPDSVPVLPSIAYVLVSPLLSTVAVFTTFFSKLRFIPNGGDVGGPAAEEFHELTTRPCCCIYGSKDVFTSDRKLQRWTEELAATPGSEFLAVRAETGHFWQEAEAVLRLRQGLTDWLKGLPPRLEARRVVAAMTPPEQS